MRRLGLFSILIVLALLTASCHRHAGMKHHGGGMSYSTEKGIEQMMSLVDTSVKDPAKAEQVKTKFSNIVEEVRSLYKRNREYHRELYELNADYNATPERFLKILDELNVRRMQSGTKILRIRFDIKEMLTEQEWDALSEGFKSLRGDYRHGRDGSKGHSGGY